MNLKISNPALPLYLFVSTAGKIISFTLIWASGCHSQFHPISSEWKSPPRSLRELALPLIQHLLRLCKEKLYVATLVSRTKFLMGRTVAHATLGGVIQPHQTKSTVEKGQDSGPAPLQLPLGNLPASQKKTLGCRALGSTLVTATRMSRREVFRISAISSLENNLGIGEVKEPSGLRRDLGPHTQVSHGDRVPGP